MSKKIGHPTILALNSGDLIGTMNKRIAEKNGVPLDRNVRPTVHTLHITRQGKEFMKSLDGVEISQEEGLKLLDLAVNKGIQVDDLKVIKANPKDYNYAFVRDGHRDDEGKWHSFGSLYVSEAPVQSWQLP